MSEQDTSVPVKNEAFLRVFFGSQWERAHVTSFAEDPNDLHALGLNHFWGGGPAKTWLPRCLPTHNTFFCVSLFKVDPAKGRQRRTKELFDGMFAIGVDDVGTKVDPGLVLMTLGEATLELETSPGNFQWFYVLDEPVLVRERAEALVNGMLKAGLCATDPGMKGVTRYLRLPVGVNTKAKNRVEPHPAGWAHRVTAWRPDVKVRAEDVAKAWGFSLDDPALSGSGTGASTTHARPVPASEDPIVEGLRALGLLRGPLSGGWLEIECPWVADHTGRADTGAAYLPGAGWKCHHGHCQDKTTEEFKAEVVRRLEDEGHGGAGFMARQVFGVIPDIDHDADEAGARARMRKGGSGGGSADTVGSFFQDTVFLIGEDRFYSLASGQLMTRAALDTVWKLRLIDDLPRGGKNGDGAPIKVDAYFAMNPAAKFADQLVYWPGQGREIVHAGKRMVNTYLAPEPVRVQGPVTALRVRRWLHLVWCLCNRDPVTFRNVVDHMAAAVAEAERKIAWALIFGGAQGIGKDLILRALIHAVGVRNVSLITPDRIAARFNAYIEARIIIVDEVKQTSRGSSSPHDQYNVLKAYVGTQPDWVQIERKGMDTYLSPNKATWYFTTNEEAPLALDPDDRRFYFVWSKMKRREEAYYAGLVRWYEDEGGLDLVGAWLRQRWAGLSAERKARLFGNAPWTEAKQAAFAASRDPVEAWVADRIEEGGQGWPDIMSAEDVIARVTEAVRDRDGSKGLPPGTQVPSATRVGRLLKRLGGERVHGGGQIKVPGLGLRRLWVTRNPGRYAAWKPADVAAAYNQQHGRMGVVADADAQADVSNVIDLEALRRAPDYPF